MTQALRLEIPAKMLPFLTEQRRHKIARGGRGSGKSWSVARLLAVKGFEKPIRWLCVREIQKSIKESSHRLLADTIQAMGLGGWYDVQQTVIKGPNGTEFVFAGLQDHTADSIKSYENFDGAWVEEAHTVSERSAQILIPTIRKPGSEIWWTYNPENEDDFIHAAAAQNTGDTLVVDINWRDNPWFPAELDAERRKLETLNPGLYGHIWDGKCRSVAGSIFQRHWFKFYDQLPARMNYYMASDLAGGPDPDEPDKQPDFIEHGVFGITESRDIYVTAWWYGQEDTNSAVDAWIELVQRFKPLKALDEKGVLLRALDSFIRQRMRETGTTVFRESLASAGHKADRALAFAALAQNGQVYLPAKAPWAMRLLNQLCAFTGAEGKQDDAVDVCSLFGRHISDMWGATPAPKPVVTLAEAFQYQPKVSDFLKPQKRAEW